MKIAVVLRKGRNFKGQKLDESNLGSDVLFLHEDRVYRAGNRYHNLVEGYSIKRREFIDTFDMKDINIINMQR